jgi:hypothetical protein
MFPHHFLWSFLFCCHRSCGVFGAPSTTVTFYFENQFSTKDRKELHRIIFSGCLETLAMTENQFLVRILPDTRILKKQKKDVFF